ncbi:E3 ubiquitin-protein ligase TRIM62-like, partial [Girardinichthys multiradiatus]|uniref:E3 ubiquitin-protein ligase TRIM62-like n=1 Tax=Girardinichthys multiradiatus TaxID=208333 RepID=UPI001FAD17BB
MAEKIALVEGFLSCHVCSETFRDPVSLSCNHSFCSSCLQKFWEQTENKNCPICKRRSSKNVPIDSLLQTHKVVCIDQAPGELKERLKSDLKSLQDTRNKHKQVEETYDDVIQHSKKQVLSTERQIRAEFNNLHQFLKEKG